ncbi:hypothetical protein M758_7G014800 [Ceratodon purpureus]|nr:hypothetical protein M758_7G014800 [Ceratodon purpureus]
MPPYSAAGAAATRQAAVPMASPAEQAYNSLCYDFPVVDTPGLAALATSYRSNLSGDGRLQFPITSRFVSGLQYLVETHFERKKASAVQNDVDRSNHLATLCGCVFFKVPARGLAAAPRDDGATLSRLLASFETLQETEQQEDDLQPLGENCLDSLSEIGPDNNRLDLGNEQMADELDDDDTEWEPIETHSSAVEPIRSPVTVSVQELSLAEWPELITKVTALGSVAPFEVTSVGAVWDDLQLTEDLINALKVLRQLEKTKSVDVIPLARLYAGVMCDRLTEGATFSTRGQEFGRLVTAIIGIAANSVDSRVPKSSPKDWDYLALRVLATLSYKLKGSGNHERALWPTVSSNLSFLEQQLSLLLVGASNIVPTEELDMIFQSLCFWLKHAPGNASVGPSLMQTGILRTALQVFSKTGTEPQMEALREFLLFAMARSKEVAQYLVEVPTFRAAISDSKFLKEDTLTRPHGLVWPLLLRAGNRQNKSPALESLSQAEDMLNLEINRAAEIADEEELIGNTVVLTRLVRVLQQLEAACLASSDKLWQSGSCLDKGLTRCYTTLCSLSATIRNLEAQDSEEDKADGQERRTEKIAELLSRILPMLKKLTAVTKGDGSSKAD